jgi:hypothetical protein
MLKINILIFSITCLFSAQLHSQHLLKGTVTEKDSLTPMPFVYIINKSNGNGTMSDNDGRFSLATSAGDTLICSYVGYLKAFFPVKKLRTDANGNVKLVMIPLPVNLSPVTVTAFRLKPYEREYMNDIIDRSKIDKLSYLTSPVSALYMQYSKEGKQIRKLARIFENLMIEEQVQKKLSREILVRLTRDEKIDYYAFRRYCYYVNDYYIVNHDGAELYSKVMDCYRSWKAEGRDQPPKRREQQ